METNKNSQTTEDREVSSNFDDFWIKRIVSARPISEKKIRNNETNKKFPKKIENFSKKKIQKKIVWFSVAYITDPALIMLYLRFRLRFRTY